MPVFLFVALWHDINENLFFWALAIIMALTPEIVTRSLASKFRIEEKYGENKFYMYLKIF